MSFTVLLYRAPADVGLPNRWEEDHFLPLGTIAQVQAELERHVPGLGWEVSDTGWGSMRGPDPGFLAHRKEGAADTVAALSIINPGRALLLALTEGTDRLLFDGEACEPVDPRRLSR